MTEGRSITLDVQYSTVYETEIPSTDGQPGAGGASGGGNWKAGDSVVLQNVPFYYASTSAGPSAYKSGTFYFYDGLCVNGRYRMTISADRCGKKPIPVNVTGWVRAEDCGATGENTGAGGTKKRSVTKAVRQVEGDVLSLSYTDSAADESDSVDITLNAEDDQWLGGWMPEKGATLRPRIEGQNWEREGDRRRIRCGLFTLDDINYKDTSSTLRMGGVSKPSDTNFSEADRKTTWKNTSIRRIGEVIAARYGLAFSFDAEDHEIECDEQDGTDSSYYNALCKNYGLILKVYARSMWVYDREAYKRKRPVKTIDRSEIIRGSFSYTTTLSGTFTGGDFCYTDPDKDCDIVCSIGGGSHIKTVNQRATSVHDAAVQLCAALNNANHGTTKIKFSLPGEWTVSAGNNIRLTGYGGEIGGKYFVDRVTHRVTKSGGFTSDLECSKVEAAFHYWDVGGSIEYNAGEEESGEDYSSMYEETSPAANAASATAGAVAGGAAVLTNAPFYGASASPEPACYKSGTFYFYDGVLVNGRYRITLTADRCGKLPVAVNVTGWVPASFCAAGDEKKTDL